MNCGRLFIFLLAGAFLSLADTRAETKDFHPILETEGGYLIGARSGGKWLDGEKAAPLVEAGTSYRLFGFTKEMGTATGGKPESVEEPCPETRSIKLSSNPKGALMAIAAPWNPLPRVPREADVTQAVYVAAVREFLGAHGLKAPKVKIARIVRIDLDGDGEEEVLINATNYGHNTEGFFSANAPEGSYSVVLLRRVVAGKVETQMVAGELYPAKKTFSAPNSYRIRSILDLDGDGKLEVVVDSSYYEGGATTIYGFKGSKMKEILTVGCGA